MTRLPWTREEIERLIPKVVRQMDDIDAAEPQRVEALPPMTIGECVEYFSRLLDAATERPLTRRECFLHGQLLCVYKHACLAEAMGKKGRFFVVHESAIQKLMDGQG